MLDKTNLPFSDDRFRKILHDLKEYISWLLRKKKQRETENDKNPLPSPKVPTKKETSWLDKLKDKVKDTLSDVSDDERGKTHDRGNTQKDELAQEYKDRYDPRDAEFGESAWESPRFAEISPSYSGYYTSAEKSIFDPRVNQWSENQQLSPYSGSSTVGSKEYSYAINLKRGLIPVPLPEWALVDIGKIYYSWQQAPIFLQDQNGCMYVQCQEAHQQLSFSFCLWGAKIQSPPTSEESEKMIIDNISPETRTILTQCQWKSPRETAKIIRAYILRMKKYSTKVQGTLHKKSNSRNYIKHLDASPILECYSANTLFCALMREAWVPSRTVLGHMAQWVSKEWTSLLSSNNGHAWSKVWDGKEWVKFDATPTEKEDGSKSDQNMDEKWEQWEDSGDGNMDENQSSESGGQPGEQSEDGTSGWESQWPSEWDKSWESKSGKDGKSSPWKTPNSWEWGKSPKDLLDEMIEKAKEDSLARQADKIQDTIEKLEKATSKEDIRKTLDESGLDEFAKDEVDRIWNDEILEQEKKELDDIRESWNEERLDEALKNSLLDEEYKKKLKEYAHEVRKAIEEAKNRVKSEMDRMGFSEREMALYQAYKDLEKEVAWEVKKQISALERLLPPKYKLTPDDRRHKSGGLLADTGALVNHALTNDPNVFRRTKQDKDPTEINMYETIVIDRSGSMGNFASHGSALRESVKAAIIRAKVLEHFKVDFSILFFDDNVESVMDFWEKFSDKRKCSVPSRLMRALEKSWGTNISAPLTYTWQAMKDERRKKWWSHFGNITFIGDGEPQSWLIWWALTWLIDQMRRDGFGITAYYIGWWRRDALEWYFWKAEAWWTVIVPNISELTPALIASYNTWLKKTLHRFIH